MPSLIRYSLTSYWLPGLLICNLAFSFYNQVAFTYSLAVRVSDVSNFLRTAGLAVFSLPDDHHLVEAGLQEGVAGVEPVEINSRCHTKLRDSKLNVMLAYV